MQISFEIIYTDKDDNYYRSDEMPAYLVRVFAHFRNESYAAFKKQLPINTAYSFDYSICNETALADLLNLYLDYMGFDQTAFYECESMVHLKTQHDFVTILDYYYRIDSLLNHYKDLEELNFYLVFSILQGDIWREGSIRYYMNSHEAGRHNKPHVHVSVGDDYNASIDIINTSIIVGELPPKYSKQILKKVETNKLYLLECWNKMTDGLKVDINYGLGLTTFSSRYAT